MDKQKYTDEQLKIMGENYKILFPGPLTKTQQALADAMTPFLRCKLGICDCEKKIAPNEPVG